MAFTPETVQIGSEDRTEYSIFLPMGQVWIAVGADGGITLSSPKPVSLGVIFDAPNAGTEKFAWKTLTWIKKNAGTGEVIGGRYVDIPKTLLRRVAVCKFTAQVPVMKPTGLDFNTEFDDETFEIRGPVRMVDDRLRRYQLQYPQAQFAVVGAERNSKTVRVSHVAEQAA